MLELAPRNLGCLMAQPAVVLLLSGGLDSMVAADVIREQSGVRLLPLFVDYGQPAALREGEAARTFCRLRHLQLSKAQVAGFKKLADVAAHRPRLQPFLPGRNLVLLTIAGIVALSKGARFVGIGAIADRAFPDTTNSFFNAFNAIGPMALGHQVSVMSPLVHSSKAAVVEMGKRLGTPLLASYSCYVGRSRPCGRCLGCKLRAQVLS